MTTYTKFSLAAKIRLHEKFTSEIFYWRKYPDLRYLLICSPREGKEEPVDDIPEDLQRELTDKGVGLETLTRTAVGVGLV